MNVSGYELNEPANIPSVSRTKSCLTPSTRPLRIASSCSGDGGGAGPPPRAIPGGGVGAAGDRQLNQFLAVEAGRRRAAFLRGDLVLPHVLIGQFDRDLKFDRDQVVAANLLGAPGRDKILDCRKPLLATERLARLRQNRRRVPRGRLRRQK